MDRNTTSRIARAWVPAAALVLFAAGEARAQWVAASECGNEASAEDFRNWVVDGDRFLTPKPVLSRTNLENRFAACKAKQTDVSEQGKLDVCFKRVRLYASLLDPPADSQLGLVVDPAANPIVPMTNAQYYGKYGPGGTGGDKNQLAIPSCLQDATLFGLLQQVNLAKTPNGVLQVVNKIKTLCDPGNTGKVIVAPYVTAATPAIDGGVGKDRHGRIIVWFQGTNISHYVQFTVNANPATPTPVAAPGRQQASIVNVIPGQGAHVFDWQRDNTTSTFKYDPGFGNDQRCYQCHLSGVLEIHPFSSADADIFNVGLKLGPTKTDWSTWLDPLNSAWATEIARLNKQIRSEYHNPPGSPTAVKGLSVLHALGADVVTAPELKQFPSPMLTVFKGPGKATCDAAFDSVALDASPSDKPRAKCSSCHTVRGSVIADAWDDGEGWSFLMTKYVHGGHMPPLISAHDALPAWSTPPGGLKSGETRPNTAAVIDRQTLAQCYVTRLQTEIKVWLKKDSCP